MKRLRSRGRPALPVLLAALTLAVPLSGAGAQPSDAGAPRPAPRASGPAGGPAAGTPTKPGAQTQPPARPPAPPLATAQPDAGAPPADAGVPLADAGAPADDAGAAVAPSPPPPPPDPESPKPEPEPSPPAPSTSASATPSPDPSASASAAPAPEPAPPPPTVEAPVRLLDRTVFTIRIARGNRTAEERARAAAQILERAAKEDSIPEVRVEESESVAVIYVGQSPLIQLGPDDAAAAGDASLGVHAASIAGKVRDILAREHSRSRAAEAVFSFSLLVFSGLIAVLILRKLRELVEKAQAWIAEHPERLPVLRLRGIEVLRPAAFKGAVSVTLGAASVLAQIGIAYTWILFALSLFKATAGLSERLTGFVLAPISAVMERVAGSVPVLVIAFVAILALVILIRFVGLFFGSVARGETSLGWLPSDLAAPTGVLVRAGMVVGFLVFAAPLVTGVEEGALSRAGMVVLVALGLACTPVLASAAVGLAVVYGRPIRVGEVAEIGGRTGRVLEISLLEVHLEDEDGCRVRVPHLLTLVHPTRLLGKRPLVAIEVIVAHDADLARAREILVTSAGGIGTRARAALVGLDQGGARFRATMVSESRDGKSRWLTAIAAALVAAGIPLGRPAPAEPGAAPRAASRSEAT